ncbi:hypothetical protein ETB97_002099 [Aspergillus alliaceus]|uniref:Uncharacterized protein n=1 Tax=Petromyces alliaceus TaxID=209559 RepID=A0A8H6E686_PETAA|nr:hypothetical protein ETB97_002099 [Aspergillus burnettii]
MSLQSHDGAPKTPERGHRTDPAQCPTATKGQDGAPTNTTSQETQIHTESQRPVTVYPNGADVSQVPEEQSDSIGYMSQLLTRTLE